MCVCSTAKRRRRQAKQKFNHLAPKQRPHYKQRAADVAARHTERVIQAERERIRRKGLKK